jgi:hypothetical protein
MKMPSFTLSLPAVRYFWSARLLASCAVGLLVLPACGDITAEDPSMTCAIDEELETAGGDARRAATFGIRAGSSAGFLDEGPTFRDYVDVTAQDGTFEVLFDPELRVTVGLEGDIWRVESVDGLVDEETCFTLLGYEEPDSEESAEHEFLNVRLRAENKRAAITAALIGSPMWLGPIPYEGYKSRCRAEIFDEDGDLQHTTRAYPIDIPKEETDRFSGGTFIEVPGNKEFASGEFVCETVPASSR